MVPLGLVLIATASLLADARLSARAEASFVVDSIADSVDVNPGDGVCADALGRCTLRAAIMEANALPGPQSIDIPAGTYTLTIEGVDEDEAATGDLDITGPTVIRGAGVSETIVDANGIDRAFDILASQVAIIGLTVTGGAGVEEGGAIRAAGSCGDVELAAMRIEGSTAHRGGGIYAICEGTTTISDSTIEGNEAVTGLVVGRGGGVFGRRVLIERSTIVGNTSSMGGGVYLGISTIMNSTITGNLAGEGGGIFVEWESEIHLQHTTVTANFAAGEGGSVHQFGGGGGVFGYAVLSHSIIANNESATPHGNDCAGLSLALSLGHNLIGNADGCIVPTPSDIAGALSTPIEPLLGPLAENGGPTLTHALLANSPAIDAGGIEACLETDQRGVLRPQGFACDIGAFELEVVDAGSPTPTNTPTNTPTLAATPTLTAEPTATETAPPSTSPTASATTTSSPTPSATVAAGSGTTGSPTNTATALVDSSPTPAPNPTLVNTVLAETSDPDLTATWWSGAGAGLRGPQTGDGSALGGTRAMTLAVLAAALLAASGAALIVITSRRPTS
jgi:CSLREA domain-containing protein